MRRSLRAPFAAWANDAPQAFPAGHFYSPVVSSTVLHEPDVSRVWPPEPTDPPGVDMRADEQLALLRRLGAHRFPVDAQVGPHAYDPTNDQFPPHDAAVLYALVRLLRPARMVEIGSGWSTTVAMAAIADGALGTQLTCIEPHPRAFISAMAGVGGPMTLREERVEHAPGAVFDDLGPGDILFIDSSHVAKTGSDVVHELLQVVPRLAHGVVVHVHDIFIPEDYPQGWVGAGFNWNEQYVLHALLIGNAAVRILLANRWLALRHPEAVRDALGAVDLDGSSFWFELHAPRAD